MATYRLKKGLQYCMPVIMFALLFSSCTQHKIPDYSDVASCVGCHTNYAHLKEVYAPDTAAAVGGCGGEAPHYEPYDRVYLGSAADYESYKDNDPHGKMSCTSCHGGVSGTHEKELAHSNEFIKHPSTFFQDKCGSCHEEISSNFRFSLHSGTGQKRKVTMRSGLEGAHQFDDLPAHQIEGYNSNCATCHGTCGNCHVNRPPIAGGGLANGHTFSKNPDYVNICSQCHTSRGRHAYFGVAAGTKPDVHLTKMGYECMDCHTGVELHGDGDSTVTHRYEYSQLPSCFDCHSEIEMATDNKYHEKHMEDFNCQVCHSQDYNNCGSCHIHGDGARVPSYLGYKIARNPIPETKEGFDFALVRRTLAAPDNWEVYLGEGNDYENFDEFPTYNYTTPHNIRKYTERCADSATVADQSASAIYADMRCGSNCHIRIVEGDTINKELYLFNDDLLVWEKDATASIVVDGHLPEWWLN